MTKKTGDTKPDICDVHVRMPRDLHGALEKKALKQGGRSLNSLIVELLAGRARAK